MKNSLPTALTLLTVLLLAVTYSAAQPKAQMAKGAKVYAEYCKTCHQATGLGMPSVFPPLAKSDYIVSNSRETTIKEVVNGKSGKVKVNGKMYNGVMAPLPAKYSAEDVAAVLTYVYNSFGNKGAAFTAAEVRKVVPKRK